MPTLPTYDSTKVSSLSLSPSQFGYVSTQGADWTDGGGSIVFTLFREIGISFDFSVNNDSERSLVLAPQLPFTAVTSDLAGTGETSIYWTLTIPTDRSSPTTTGVELYAVDSPNPSVWSGSTNTPITNRTTLGESFLIDTATTTSSHWVLNGSTYDLVFELDFTSDFTEASAGATVRNPLVRNINDPLWNGLVQFHFDKTSSLSAGTWASTVTFTGYVHSWHTGATGFPMDQRGRVVHDYITGQPYFSPKAIPDGYREGIMVHPDNFDPADPLEEDPWTPPPSEGVVDDEIIDVEN